MKKVLLIFWLVVLFFSQSVHSDTTYKGFKSGFDWKHITDGKGLTQSITQSVVAYYKGKGYFSSKIIVTYNPYQNNFNKIYARRCFDFDSKTYFNLDLCGEIEFLVESLYTSKKKTQNFGYEFINNAMKDFCEDAIIERKKLKPAIPLLGRQGTSIRVKCPKAIAKIKIREEKSKLAQQKRKEEQEQKKVRQEERKKQQGNEQEEYVNPNIEAYTFPDKEKDNNGIDNSKVIAASSGTGFFVSSNGHMVTNNHVIDACDNVQAHYKGKIVDTDVLFVDRANDLAIIKANLKPKKIFSVSNEDISLLEDIIVAGYPLGKEISASIKTFKGSVTALAGYGDNYSNFQIDASLNSGNSGGPILDQKGNIVGVAVAKWIEDGVEGFNFGVKSSTLKTFASSNQFEFQDPSTEELSNKELGQLITEATIYLECWMTVAKIKQIIQEGERQKAFFSEYK